MALYFGDSAAIVQTNTMTVFNQAAFGGTVCDSGLFMMKVTNNKAGQLITYELHFLFSGYVLVISFRCLRADWWAKGVDLC